LVKIKHMAKISNKVVYLNNITITDEDYVIETNGDNIVKDRQ